MKFVTKDVIRVIGCMVLVSVITSNSAYASVTKSEVLNDSAQNIVSSEVFKNTEVQYGTAMSLLVYALDERDSKYFEIETPSNIKDIYNSYDIQLSTALKKPITKVEFIKLYTDLENSIHKDKLYSSSILDIKKVFTDLDNCSKDELDAIEKAYIAGLFGKSSDGKFNPDEILTEAQVMDCIKSIKEGLHKNENYLDGYSSCFSVSARNEVLNQLIHESLKTSTIKPVLEAEFGYIGKMPVYEGLEGATGPVTLNRAESDKLNVVDENEQDKFVVSNDSNDKAFMTYDRNTTYSDIKQYFKELEPENKASDKEVTTYEFMEMLNSLFRDQLFYKTEDNKFDTFVEDSSLITRDRLDFLNERLDSPIKLSDALLLYHNFVNCNNEMTEIKNFNKFGEIQYFTENYLHTANDFVTKQGDCFEYFLSLGGGNRLFNSHNNFLVALHESHHEASTELSKCFSGRLMTEDDTQIKWKYRPDIHNYYNFVSGDWFELKDDYRTPTSAVVAKEEFSNIEKSSPVISLYTKGGQIGNDYGLFGALQEMAAYAVELKTAYEMYGLDIFDNVVLKARYTDYTDLKIMVLGHLDYLKNHENELYTELMSNRDFTRYLNDTFSTLDDLENANSKLTKDFLSKDREAWLTEITNK